MKHLNNIYQALLNRKDKIVHKAEIIGLADEYNQRFMVSLSIADIIKYLSRHSYIKRIFKGYYYINTLNERKLNYCEYEDKELLFAVLAKLSITWYVGLSSALYLSGKHWQPSQILHIVNNKFSGTRKIFHLKVRFFKIKDKLFIGLEKTKTAKNNITYLYSNPAKTYLDMAYLKKTPQLTRNNDTPKYLQYYPKWLSKK